MWGDGFIASVFVTAPCAVGTQGANISVAVATSHSVTDIRSVGAACSATATRDTFHTADV